MERAATNHDDEPVPDRTDLLVAAIEQLPVGVWIDGGRGERLYANAAARERDAASDGPGALVDRAFEHVHQLLSVGDETFGLLTSIDVTKSRQLEDQLTRRAFYDDLTGLPKRDLFERTINNMIEEGCPPFALSFIDLDNFKFVNDYYGHAVGDQLLVKVAQRIFNSVRATDLLARVGGDEFVLLTTPIDSFEAPGPEIERLSERFRDPFFIDGFEIFTSASIGVSLYPVHGNGYAVLRGNADSAMYRVKGSSKGGVALYDPKFGHAASERMELEQRLRVAIRDKRICCAFQPKVDFRTNIVVGVEVLLRWKDENGDIRAPGDIIKLAIELGLMDDVTLTILEQVAAQIDLINDAFGKEATISLNVAAKQAGDTAFMLKFIEALRQTGYPGRFIVELTEEAFFAKGEFQTTVLPLIREIGAGISIDDFGVGYSSLSALAEITADELKVDRSFITDIHLKPRNQSIVKVIELLGNALNMRIVVEGVETYEELAYLMAATRISCAQGYYFAKPMFLQSQHRAQGGGPSDARGGLGNRDFASCRSLAGARVGNRSNMR